MHETFFKKNFSCLTVICMHRHTTSGYLILVIIVMLPVNYVDRDTTIPLNIVFCFICPYIISLFTSLPMRFIRTSLDRVNDELIERFSLTKEHNTEICYGSILKRDCVKFG